jgi:hypothetical protein
MSCISSAGFSTSPCPLHVSSSVKLASLDIDTVLLHGHAQIFHGQDSLPLTRASLPTTTIPAPLHAQCCTLLTFRTGRACTSTAATRTTSKTSRSTTSGTAYAGTTERIVGRCGIRTSDPRVLIRISCNVRDELLGRKGQ